MRDGVERGALSRWALVLAALAGCPHQPTPGDACSTPGYACQDASTAAECRGGAWVSLPCRGPAGCTALGDGITCDTSTNQAGDACASASEGDAQCTPDGYALLRCQNGALVQESECSFCAVSDGNVICEPGSPPDGGTDGGTDGGMDGGTGVVAVTCLTAGKPQPSVNVVFQDPQGGVVAHLQTGTDGRASHSMPPGSMVTIALEDKGEYGLVSWVGVDPGDELTFDSQTGMTPVPPAIANVTLPGALAGASAYDISMCGLTQKAMLGQPVGQQIPSQCVGSAGKLDALGMAFDGGGNPVGFAMLAGASLPSGSVDLQLPPWQTTFDNFGMQVKHAPAGTARLLVQLSLYDGAQALRRFVDDSQSISAGGGATYAFKSPHGAGDTMLYAVGVNFGPTTLDGSTGIVRRVASSDLVQSVDLTADLLPHVHSASLDLTDDTRPAIQWTTDGPMTGADGAVLNLRWTMPAAHSWVLLADPKTPAPLRLPALPDALSAWRPSGASFAPPSVAFVDYDLVSSWAQMRQKAAPTVFYFTDLATPFGDFTRASLVGW